MNNIMFAVSASDKAGHWGTLLICALDAVQAEERARRFLDQELNEYNVCVAVAPPPISDLPDDGDE